MQRVRIALVVDGSVLEDGRSGCGGYIQDYDRTWLGAFSCKLTSVPLVCAELLGITLGLNWCWDRGLTEITLLTDSLEAINYLLRGCEEQHPFKELIDDARTCYHRDWRIQLCHVYREHIETADRLSKFSHSLVDPFCTFYQPPSFIEWRDVPRT